MKKKLNNKPVPNNPISATSPRKPIYQRLLQGAGVRIVTLGERKKCQMHYAVTKRKQQQQQQ